MSIQDLGSLGEFIAAITVVASLVYLSVQIRQNTRSLRVAAFQSAIDAVNQTDLVIVGDVELEALSEKGMRDYCTLDDLERGRFNRIIRVAVRNFEMSLYLDEQGFMPIDINSVYERLFAVFLSTPGGREWWTSEARTFSDELQKHFNARFTAQFRT